MTYTKLQNSLLISTLLFVGAFVFGASSAHAALSADFSTDPLFSEANFLPGDEVTETVTVGNGFEETQEVFIEAVNISDPDDWSEALTLVLTEGATTHFNGSFSDFLSGGKLELSDLLPSDSTTYSLTISFPESENDNEFQNATLGFDICVGFSGGSLQCGDTVVSDEQDTGGGGGGDDGGGIGGSAGGGFTLIIINERVSDTNPVLQSAFIEWETNLLATSQVIYGSAEDGPYTLDLDEPNFGYPLATEEITTKTVNHGVTLEGIIPGVEYRYRVVSRASPATVSPEHSFILALEDEVAQAQNTPSNTLSGPEGEVAGVTVVEDDDTDESDDETVDRDGLVAGVGALDFSGAESTCMLIALLILIILFALWYLMNKEKRRDTQQQRNHLLRHMSLGSAIVLVILILLGFTCISKYLLLALIILLLLSLFRFFTGRRDTRTSRTDSTG